MINLIELKTKIYPIGKATVSSLQLAEIVDRAIAAEAKLAEMSAHS